MKLSIAIPAYNRAPQLDYSLARFTAQIPPAAAGEVEIVVCDDASTDATADVVRRYATNFPYVRYERNAANVGLERNLVHCTRTCRGEYLWIFGDDDFLEYDGAFAHLYGHLAAGTHDFYVLNRTRRSFDLGALLSGNWMKINPAHDRFYPGLRAFCREWGLISVLGFITVNVFKRAPFQAVDDRKYYGVMYPQLGMMLEAFHATPCRLLATPLVCHRTQTSEEKRQALGSKQTEKDFMADVARRDATYFSYRLIRFLDQLEAAGAVAWDDVVAFEEHTVIAGKLVDFIRQNMALCAKLGIPVSAQDHAAAAQFFERCAAAEKPHQAPA